MKASALKAIAENLGRFASVRENAPYPSDRILVQNKDGELKMVAMATHGTLVASVSETSDPDYRVIIGSRDFLSTIKSLPAKEEVEIKPAYEGWYKGIYVNENFFERIDTAVPAEVLMPKVEPMPGGYVDIPDAKEFGKMADALSAGWSKGVQFGGAIVTGNQADIRVAIWDGYKYGTRRYAGNYEVFGWVTEKYIASVRGLKSYRIDFDPANSLAIIRAEGYVCYGTYHFLSTSVPLTEAGVSKPTTNTVVDRIAFKKSLQEQSRLDKYERVVLRYVNGTLQVLPYEEDTQEWAASGRFLIQLLDGTSSKRIGFGLREVGGPISMKVDQWRIELAPVKQLEKKSIATVKTIPADIYVA